MADVATAAASTPAADVVAELEAAYDRIREIEAEVDEIGEANVEAAADAYRNATRLLDSYEASATGTGDFGAYLEFQNKFIALAESLPESAMAADAVQRASDRMDKRRLTAADFDYAREQVNEAAEAIDLLEAREEAHDDYRSARHDAKARNKELESEVDHLHHVQELGTADLDTSLDPLREPVKSYNAAVREAFETFRTAESARELFDLLAAGAERPLVGVDRPPSDLADYIHSAPAGEEPLSTLREYAEYSPSKLDHYVDDPGALRTHVSVHQTYLKRLGPEPLLIDWPPAEAGVVRARLQELAPLVRRLDAATDRAESSGAESDESEGDSEPIEHHRRQLARLTRTDDYDRLRQVAVADAELNDEEFERLASGAIEDDLAAVEAGIDAIDTALAEYTVD
ncbi:hypothetical protein halTADL_2140 [Halohasta litchfieldiae]|jgi:hypothetical protein|uniref:Uncharacterized protein n=1 Tax=Halohasta litchfieldiae TaxID=1073996 RepID=A0A1H6TK65_9EURY|nr:hypothetical protein [Halohasta litchfieldiae]ATW88887.1 hypothetical protein halTADL_2140 [Halohasta litchfieldiae]SEI80411.1 hypothetical protein SAMN05444271_108101 [Halohasta litchfieldiae]